MATAIESPPASEVEHPGLYEVVDGQVREKPPMGAFEAEIASILLGWLTPFARDRGLGRAISEVLFRIDPEACLDRRPDVAFLSAERWPLSRRAPRTAAWEVVPDLAIEVISPTNSANEVQRKVGEYFAAGVRQVWVIYPLHALVHVYEAIDAIRVLRREAGDALDGGAIVPGFRLPLATLFGEPEEAPAAPA